jgi:hypothetical protein
MTPLSESPRAERRDRAMMQFSVRIELYEHPWKPAGYRGALTREGFIGLALPAPGDRLQGVGGFAWCPPFPVVAYVDHWFDHLDDVEAPDACRRTDPLPACSWHVLDGPGATVVAHAHAHADAIEGEPAREAYEQQGWRWWPLHPTEQADQLAVGR